MLLDWDYLTTKYDLARKATGIVHCGAHLAEEADRYARLGVPVWWVEANPAVLPKIGRVLGRYPNQRLIHALIAERDDGERVLHVTNYDGMSSSVFEFGTHPTFSPDTVFVNDVSVRCRTLDSLVAEHDIKANLLVMDLQGAEIMAVVGGYGFIEDQVDWIMTEVNVDEVYKGCGRLDELDWRLAEIDPGPPFRRVETCMVPGQGWGDAWFVREHLIP